MLTGDQLRAARAALGWTQQALAIVSKVAARNDQAAGIDPSQSAKPHATPGSKAALEFAGVEFIGTPEDRPGVRVELPTLDLN